MRAPYQVLALPYRYIGSEIRYAVFHRSSMDMWQFISGGGEDDEKPEEAVCREIWEEAGIRVSQIHRLKSMCHIPTGIYPQEHRQFWPDDLYVLPEFSFAFECDEEIQLSHEHTHYEWLPYKEAVSLLKFDSNRTALYELNQSLLNRKINREVLL
jgi:dATP pyrophosphohydrolase